MELHSNWILIPRVQLRTAHLHTLNDFQQMLGHIQWLRPYLKLPTDSLLSIYEILWGDPDPTSPYVLSPAANEALIQIAIVINQHSCFQISYARPLYFIVLPTPHTPTGVFWQHAQEPKLKGKILLWVHMPSALLRVISIFPRTSGLTHYERMTDLSPIFW